MRNNGEKRTSDRVQLEDFQRVRDAQSGKLIGYLGDISEVGVKVLCKTPVPLNETSRLKITYIRIGGEREVTEVDVMSLWERDEEDVPVHEIGFQFINLEESAHEGVLRIMEDLERRRGD